MALLCRKIGISLRKDAHPVCNGIISVTKAQQLLQGLQTADDEGQQLTAAMEMCQVCIINDNINIIRYGAGKNIIIGKNIIGKGQGKKNRNM